MCGDLTLLIINKIDYKINTDDRFMQLENLLLIN
jgi:hypothetical protein